MDLFEHTADKHRDLREIEALRSRIMKLERENLELRMRATNLWRATRHIWGIQVRGARTKLKEVLA